MPQSVQSQYRDALLEAVKNRRNPFILDEKFHQMGLSRKEMSDIRQAVQIELFSNKIEPTA